MSFLTPYALAMMAASACGPELNEASTLLRAQQLVRAVEVLEQASAHCPASAQVFDLLGIANDVLGKTEQAQLAFRKAIEIDPKSARPRVNLAVSLFRIGKEREAVARLEEAVTLEPRNTLANANLGAYHARRGECDRSLRYFEAAGGDKASAVRTDPEFRLLLTGCLLATGQEQRAIAMLPTPQDKEPSPLRFSLGLKLAEHGLYGPAINQFSAIPEPERDAAVWFNLGLAHSRQQQFEAARAYYFTVIDADSAHVEAYFRIALDFADQGESSKAIPWLWRVRRMAPQRADVAAALAEQLISAHYLQSANAVLEAAALTGNSDRLLEVAQGDLAMEQARIPEAASHYQKALELDANSGAACAGLARSLLAQSRDTEAGQLLRGFLARRPADTAVNFELGLLEVQGGNFTAAIPMLERAWNAGRFNLRLAADLARAYRRSNRAADAVALLRPLRPRFLGNRTYHYELAQAYTTLKRTAEAEAELAAVQRIEKSGHEGLRFTAPAIYIH